MLFVISCQQKDLLVPQQDLRDELIGTYTGTIQIENKAEDNNNQESTVVDDVIENQTVVISKSNTAPNGLIINGDESNILIYSPDSPNEYNDMSLYTADECNGIKVYQLQFFPLENKLTYHHKHRHDCDFGSLQQKSIFEGIKKH